MRSEGISKRKIAWRGSCLLFKAAFDFAYSIGIVFLALLVCVVAYVMTLEETPMPDFLIRLLERELEAQGATLRMSGIRIQPSGRITIDDPVIHSTDLQSEIARADLISIKIEPALFLFGQTQLVELDVLNGSIITPGLLSPSGTPEAIVDKIDLRAENHRNGWSIKRAKFRYADTRVTTSGIIDFKSLSLPQTAPKPAPASLSERLVAFHKNALKAKQALEPIEGLEGRIELMAPRGPRKRIRAVLTAATGRWKDQLEASDIQITINALLDQSVSVNASVASLLGPEKTFAQEVKLDVDWADFPSPKDWRPDQLHLSIGSGGQNIECASHIAVQAANTEGGDVFARASLMLADSSWSVEASGNPDTRKAEVALSGSPTPGLVGLASTFAKRPLESFASIIDQPYIEASAQFDRAWMPVHASARMDVGRIVSRGALFDRAIAQARFQDKHVEVSNLWLRTGPQNGWLSVSFGLETQKRRLLIKSLYNPHTLLSWIPQPWWVELWENFRFSPEGFHCLLDSSQIVKRPETLQLTGSAYGKDLVIRGHRMQEIETSMYILQNYIDLYNTELSREEGYARGETQFAMARDPRDDKYKMTGLWIDAETTLDLGIAPDLIHEVRSDVEAILAPYGYETPPYVRAKSSSFRDLDHYTYDVDLDLKTDHAFSYHHYPFEAVSAKALISNGRASLPSIEATIAGGQATAKADVTGEKIELEVSLKDAHFGNTLKSSAIYFAANDKESSASSFSPEELSSYGGKVNLSFSGQGLVGDSLSYIGKGDYQIVGADFYRLQLFGGFSKLLENASLPFTTLKFEDAQGGFNVAQRYVEFPEIRLKGPIAQIRGDGNYDLEEGDLDFKARLQLFRSMPLINIPGRVLDLLTGIFEVKLTGTIAEPKWGLFRGQQERDEDRAATPETAPPAPQKNEAK